MRIRRHQVGRPRAHARASPPPGNAAAAVGSLDHKDSGMDLEQVTHLMRVRDPPDRPTAAVVVGLGLRGNELVQGQD